MKQVSTIFFCCCCYVQMVSFRVQHNVINHDLAILVSFQFFVSILITQSHTTPQVIPLYPGRDCAGHCYHSCVFSFYLLLRSFDNFISKYARPRRPSQSLID
uniref:Uncharacterized protein n=1 Tax=Trypanosoma vivax (strain Y486) TaxID=1055687 RepID=G0U375_TRYVY|nr:hypothetical protein TVY486_0905510 [Trypanosoma vivax Y486]